MKITTYELFMLKKERQAHILRQVNVHRKVLSSLPSQEIRVSEDPFRRDLQELADEGKIIKVHGTALSPSFNEVHYSADRVYSPDHKKFEYMQHPIKDVDLGIQVL